MAETQRPIEEILAQLKMERPELFDYPGQQFNEVYFGTKDPEDADRNVLSLQGSGYTSARTGEEFIKEFSSDNKRPQKIIFISIEDSLKMKPLSKR